MKRLLALLVPLIALTGCATYGDGYYRDRTVYRDGGYYYPAYDGDGDYYYGAESGYDYDYDYRYGSSIGYGYGYGYSPFWGLDRYRCRSYYGCVPSWGGYYPYHYAPGWSFSIGNTWGWNNWGWYGGYRWNERPRYYPRPDYSRDRPRPMPKPTGRIPPAQSAPAYRPPGGPAYRSVVSGERVRAPGTRAPAKPARVQQDNARPMPKPTSRYERKPVDRFERAPEPRARALVQPAPAQAGGARMRYPEPVRTQPRQQTSRPQPVIRQSQGERYVRPAAPVRSVPQARPAPAPRAAPVAKPSARQAPPPPRPAPRPQVRRASQNNTSEDEL